MTELVTEFSVFSISGKNQSSNRSEFPALLFSLDYFDRKA